MSSSVNLEDFRIPLEELKSATNNFDSSSRLKLGVYRGELSERWQNRTAYIKQYNKEEYESHQLEIVSRNYIRMGRSPQDLHKGGESAELPSFGCWGAR
ncbi:hypothetical protein Tco_1574121 [Tanacetum coccineum]